MSTLLIFLCLCLGAFLQATASPLAVTSLESSSLVKRYEGDPSGKVGNGGPDASDYQDDNQIATAFTVPEGPFVFFSGIGDSQAPYNFAQTLDPKGAILRSTFTKGLITRGKPQRSEQWFQDFLDRASGYYVDQAVQAGNPVFFVGKWNYEVDDCSIWNRIEYNTLLSHEISITLVDYTNFDNKKPYEPPTKKIRDLEKRAQDYCFNWQGDREDPADPDSSPSPGLGYYPGWCGVHVVQVSSTQHPPLIASFAKRLPVPEERRSPRLHRWHV